MNGVKIAKYVVSLVVLSGCLPDVSGDPPPGDKLIYPVGLSTTKNDEYLLVANSNYDLRYNAGTLVAIDLDKLDSIREAGGKSDWQSKNGRQLYVPEEELIHEESTIRMDAFASDLELTPKGNRVLIPVRGGSERHILIVDVDEEKKNGRVLGCGEGDDLKCNGAHKVTSNDKVTLPIEPYEVAILDYEKQLVDDEGNKATITSTIGFATHLYSGAVSSFMIENNEGKLDAELLSVMGNVVPEASGIAVNSQNNEVYVSGRLNAEKYIAVLKVMYGGMGGTYTNDPIFGWTDKIEYSGDLYGGTDARGIAVSPSGKTAVVVTRTPSALLRIDTETREVVDMVSIGTDPSVVQIFEDEENGGVYAFILCFKSNNVYIVEPNTMKVYVRSTGSGPHAVAFDKKRKYAYIANFRESTITIIEATPPFNHVRVEGEDVQLMIGKPRLPDDHN